MSSRNSSNDENFDFIGRFVEICGSSQPAEVARLLNISYGSARNYLNGRLPDSSVLANISEQTPYSIHWLLTGKGKKFVENGGDQGAVVLSDQLREFVRRECLELINEILNSRIETDQSKTVVLTSEQIMEEKVLADAVTFSGEQQ